MSRGQAIYAGSPHGSSNYYFKYIYLVYKKNLFTAHRGLGFYYIITVWSAAPQATLWGGPAAGAEIRTQDG